MDMLEDTRPRQLYRKLLEDTSTADVTIVASNGAKISCHKAILSVHSDKLKYMLKMGTKKGQRKQIRMGFMSEDCIKAFLAFLYCFDTTEAAKNCYIAEELLQAGESYGIPDLTKAMVRIFLLKTGDWCTVDVALLVFNFARSYDDKEAANDLKLMVARVLKRNKESLHQCDDYNMFFQTDPEAGMELCQVAFSV